MNEQEFANMFNHELKHWWYQGLQDLLGKFLSNSFMNYQSKSRQHPLLLLDAGCGTGGNTWIFKDQYKIISLDISLTALKFCQTRNLERLVQGSVDLLPFPDDTFDGIFTMDVLYHLNVTDTISALKEMSRVLKPGGILLIQLPAFERLKSAHDVAIHTRQRFHIKEVSNLLDESNFKVKFLTYRNFLLFPLIAISRILSRDKTSHNTSDVSETPILLNFILKSILKLENLWLERQKSLPIGLSIWGVVTK